jgi:hypothetical protein
VSAASLAALAAALIAVAPPEEPPPAPEENTANPFIIAGSSLAIVGAVGAWGWGAWWNEGFHRFHLLDTGFFERDTYAGGSDKLGHMYVTYICTLWVTRLYEALGMDHRGALWLSAGAVTLVANGIELADGFTEFGFEYSDVVFNTLGIAAAFAAELSPEFHSMFGMRLGYVPSTDFLRNDKTFIKWINDYTGMLFFIDLKLKGLHETFQVGPEWLKYFLTGIVWGTDQYSPVRVHEDRRRSFGVHVGISLPELLREVYPADPGVEKFAVFFDYYALPFLSVIVMSDLNTGEWMLNFGVSNRLELGP